MLWDPKNKKSVSSRYVTLDVASMVKPTVSRQVELGKTKLGVLQWVESDASSRSPGGSVCLVLVGNLTGLTPGRDHVALRDTKHIEAVVPVVSKEPRRIHGSGL